VGSGIHGGTIYIRGQVPRELLGVSANIQTFTGDDRKLLEPIFKEFCNHFKIPIKRLWEREIVKITPSSSRPYGAYYNPRSV
jgi:glutamate synthase domain-containing protein 3